MSTLEQLALRDALADRATYRAMCCAALDELHAAQRKIESQQRQLAELREEIARYGRSVFGG